MKLSSIKVKEHIVGSLYGQMIQILYIETFMYIIQALIFVFIYYKESKKSPNYTGAKVMTVVLANKEGDVHSEKFM